MSANSTEKVLANLEVQQDRNDGARSQMPVRRRREATGDGDTKKEVDLTTLPMISCRQLPAVRPASNVNRRGILSEGSYLSVPNPKTGKGQVVTVFISPTGRKASRTDHVQLHPKLKCWVAGEIKNRGERDEEFVPRMCYTLGN